MTTDNIEAIGINEAGQLFIKPEKECFALIWRSAAEVHWNDKNQYLFSPKPREWSYFDWYKHIVDVVNDEYGCTLIRTTNSVWINVPKSIQEQSLNNS